ncbi:hypothetical protein DYB37_012948 [Aphanomyces astaci]|uniref:Uncharacterized protein n=1 Tax=Aphanomyces astaci TaxID=112090 RepID=A0A418EE52_APHAT|nr:hypothetical protein DYB37_012948 [Aphanomyces astaci]
MTPDNQTRLVEGIGSTIDLSVAEATAVQKALEEQVTQTSSHWRNLEDASLARKSRLSKTKPCRPMVAPSKILCESPMMSDAHIGFSSEVDLAGCCQIRGSGV